MYYRYKGLDEVININTILNIIGIIFILLSIGIIIRNSKREQEMYEEISSIYDDVKYYYNSLGKSINSFDDLIEKNIEKNDKIQEISIPNADEKHQENDTSSVLKEVYMPDNTNEEKIDKSFVHDKVFELKKIGLSNIEIAQKLKIGIREVEIILKMKEKV